MAKPRKASVSPSSNASAQASATKMLLIGGGVLLVVLVVLAVVLAKPWEGTKEDADLANAAPYQPSTIEGTALPELAEGQDTDPAVDKIAPTIKGATFTGQSASITADGKPKAVIFFAHWCPHCQKELPELSQWLKNNKNNTSGVEFAAVATGTTPTRPNFPPAKWFQNEKYPFPVIADDATNKIAAAYGLKSYPYFVFIDGTNKVVARTSGEISMTELQTYLDRLAPKP